VTPAVSPVLERVAADGLLAPGRPAVVMLSGGRDSVCLLDLAVRIAGPQAVRALHVNYRLRPEADEDERFCHSLGVEVSVIRPGRPAGGNLQAWAREVRYAAAAELAGGDDIAAGHTATDQVETILYRLASSPSRRALLGMRPRDGSLIRPLLGLTREETAAYCRQRGLSWREDATNDGDRYARGRVRGAVVPALRSVHPAAEANLLALSAVLRDEAEVLDALVDEVLGGADAVSVQRLRALPPALGRLIVQRLADRAVGGLAPGAGRRLQEICALDNGSALDLPHGVRAVVGAGMLRMTRTPPMHAVRPRSSPGAVGNTRREAPK
jgi:tRNA(Ile)-lysidine synthase